MKRREEERRGDRERERDRQTDRQRKTDTERERKSFLSVAYFSSLLYFLFPLPNSALATTLNNFSLLPSPKYNYLSLSVFLKRGYSKMSETRPKECLLSCGLVDKFLPPLPLIFRTLFVGFPGGSDSKESACRDLGRSLGQEDPLEKGMATHSSILAWRIPLTEEPGGFQSVESQRVRHD